MGSIGKLSKISGLGDAVGAINALVDAVGRITPIESPSVKPSFTGSGVSLRINNDSINKPKLIIPEDFTIKSITKNKVTMYGGSIIIGYAEYGVGETELTLNTEKSILGWEYSIDGLTLSIVNFGSTFATDPNYIRRKLYKFTKTGDNVKLDYIYKPEIFPANFGNI